MSNTFPALLRPRWLSMALLVSTLLACSGAPETGSPPRAERVLPVQAVEIQPRDLSREVLVSGLIEPLRTVRLAARTEGVLSEVNVQEGDQVAMGQLLARIDVAEQQAELRRAEVLLEQRQLAFARISELHSRELLDQTSFEAARSELSISRADVDLWQTRVDFGKVLASVDARVVARHVEPGEAVTRHQVLLELADLSQLVLRLGVSELDVVALGQDSAVELHIDALGNEARFAARIARIFPASMGDSRLITVEILVPEHLNERVRPGFLARARLSLDQRADVLAVPENAVAEADGGLYVMLIDADERLQRVPVSAGQARGGWLEIREGLDPGMRVVASNPLDLSEGQRVRIVGWAG